MTETGRDKLKIERIKCPTCKQVTASELWREVEVGCEDCGTHDGLQCPSCEDLFDHVWGFDELLKESGVMPI